MVGYDDGGREASLALAERLRASLSRKGLRVEDLERATGGAVSTSAVRHWLSKDPRQPGAFALAAVASALEVSVDWLITGNHPAPLGHAVVCDPSLIERVLATTDADEIERLLPMGDPVRVSVFLPRKPVYVTAEKAHELFVRVNDHLEQHAPRLSKAIHGAQRTLNRATKHRIDTTSGDTFQK